MSVWMKTEFSYRPFLKSQSLLSSVVADWLISTSIRVPFNLILFIFLISNSHLYSEEPKRSKSIIFEDLSSAPFLWVPWNVKKKDGRGPEKKLYTKGRTLLCTVNIRAASGFVGKANFEKLKSWNWIRKELLFLKKKPGFAFVGRLKWPKGISAAPLLFW